MVEECGGLEGGEGEELSRSGGREGARESDLAPGAAGRRAGEGAVQSWTAVVGGQLERETAG